METQVTPEDPRLKALRIELGERYGIPPEEEISSERLERFAKIEAERSPRRKRRGALAVAWKQARFRGVFKRTESERSIRRRLENAILEGSFAEAARLRELLRLRRLHAKMAPVYAEMRAFLYWRGAMEAVEAAAECFMPATQRLARASRARRRELNLEDEERAVILAKRRARKAKRTAAKRG